MAVPVDDTEYEEVLVQEEWVQEDSDDESASTESDEEPKIGKARWLEEIEELKKSSLWAPRFAVLKSDSYCKKFIEKERECSRGNPLYAKALAEVPATRKDRDANNRDRRGVVRVGWKRKVVKEYDLQRAARTTPRLSRLLARKSLS